MAVFEDDEQAVILYLQSAIYPERDSIQLDEEQAKKLEKTAQDARQAVDYRKAKLRAICQWLNEKVGVNTGTDYLAEVRIFREETGDKPDDHA